MPSQHRVSVSLSQEAHAYLTKHKPQDLTLSGFTAQIIAEAIAARTGQPIAPQDSAWGGERIPPYPLPFDPLEWLPAATRAEADISDVEHGIMSAGYSEATAEEWLKRHWGQFYDHNIKPLRAK